MDSGWWGWCLCRSGTRCSGWFTPAVGLYWIRWKKSWGVYGEAAGDEGGAAEVRKYAECMCVFRDGGDEAAVGKRGEEDSGRGGRVGSRFCIWAGADGGDGRAPVSVEGDGLGMWKSCIAPTLQIRFFLL